MVVNLYVKQPTFDDTKVNLPPEELRKKKLMLLQTLKQLFNLKNSLQVLILWGQRLIR